MDELAVVVRLNRVGDGDAFFPEGFDEQVHVLHAVVDHELFGRRFEVTGRFLERTPLGESFPARVGALPPFEDGTVGIGVQS